MAMGTRARAVVQRSFDWGHVARTLSHAYAEALEAGSQRRPDTITAWLSVAPMLERGRLRRIDEHQAA